jgi:hypothetical protein
MRVCESNSWRKALAKIGEAVARGWPPQEFLAEGIHENQLLAGEMKQLAVQDEELRTDLWRLANLEQGLHDLQRSTAGRPKTTSVQQTSDQGALPYGAALAADVRIGRRTWSHSLTQRTFTFAHVYGDIQSLEIKCREQTQQLQYEAGAEWTLPPDWQGCDLSVAAPRGTTFTLFEFE